MRVFITGGTGFIGTRFVKRIVETDHELVCLCRKTSDTRHLEEAGARICIGDVTDSDSLLAGMEGCDWVANLAALYSWWEPDVCAFDRINVEGTRNVMESALEAGVSKVVHVSTMVVYDGPTRGYARDCEDYLGSLPSEYARTKYRGDLICWDLHAREHLPLVVVYPAAVLGGDDTKAMGDLVRNTVERRFPFRVGDNRLMTYVHVKDVGEAILRALEKSDNIGERYPVGGHTMTTRELYEMIGEVSGVKIPRVCLPDSMVKATASLCTAVANLTKRKPIMGVSSDLMNTMMQEPAVDGNATCYELGMTYTPIRVAVEEEVASVHVNSMKKVDSHD